MDKKRWQTIREVFHAVESLNPVERAAALDARCADDPELRQEVEALLDKVSTESDAVQEIVSDAAASMHEQSSLPATIGPYRVLELIGRGGMGQVYLAERDDEELKQKVAIKVVGWFANSDALIERFLSERQILADLDHPNIARLFDGGRTHDNVPYLVMEYVDGVSVDRYCTENDLSLTQRLTLFLKICDAIQHAHGRLVIHRDIKPSNIIVTHSGVPKLLDFGIAKLLDPAANEQALTRADMRLLTPQYASPEQLLGLPVTTQTDVYGLGVLLYQLTTGEFPYDTTQTSSPELERLICETEPGLPSLRVGQTERSDAHAGPSLSRRQLSSQLRGDLDNIVMMALRKEPLRRYATVKELADDIRNHLDNKPVSARKDSASYRLGKFVRRNRAGVIAASLVVAAIAAQTVFYTTRLSQERDNALAERQVAENTTEFLVDLFDVSDPGKSLGESITAREVLDQGAVKIREELKDDKEIRARMLQTIGRVYERLGLFDSAKSLMEEAVLLNREVLPPSHERFIDSLDELSWLYYREEDWKKAQDTSLEALNIQRELAGGDNASMARTLNQLGTITYYLDDYEGSLSYYQRAIDALSAPEYRDDELRGTSLNHIGIVYALLSRNDEAEKAYRESLDIRLRTLGDQHPDTATAYVNLGSFYQSVSKLDEAYELAVKGYNIDKATKGDRHVDVAYDLGLLGAIALDRKDYATALRHRKLASEIWKEAAGPRHSRYATSLDGLSELSLKMNKLEDARRYAEEGLEIMLSEYGPEHTLTSNLLYTMGKVHYRSGETGDARSRYERSLAIRLAKFGETNRQTWAVQHELSRIDFADKLYQRVIDQNAALKNVMTREEATDLPLFTRVDNLLARARVCLSNGAESEGCG